MTLNDHPLDEPALASRGRLTGTRRNIDRLALELGARDLLCAVDAAALGETPRRVADAYAELLTPQPFRAATFPHDDAYDHAAAPRGGVA